MQTLILPKVINGTSGLGNLYTALSDEVKLDIVKESIRCGEKPVVFDSAGKYGAGLALESLGRCLKLLNADPNEVIISNKLGWLRTELKTAEPTFEPGVWKNLNHDAVQQISYDGILECYEQGNTLLNGYKARLVSVHDPDEYIAAATGQEDAESRYQDILDAYRALGELKAAGKVDAVGIGSKDWRIIAQLNADVKLDWVMIANSITIHSHPKPLLNFMDQLEAQGTTIINSAVFNGGFLTGLDFYNYKPVTRESDAGLFEWRDSFYQTCEKFNIKPAAACIAFGLSAPGVKSIALNTTNAARVGQNLEMAVSPIPPAFWETMTAAGMIDKEYTKKYLLRK
jgi:D-threo-aldose 1-dehydrogenase